MNLFKNINTLFLYFIMVTGLTLLIITCGKRTIKTVAEETSALEAGVYKKGTNIMFVYYSGDPYLTNVAITGDFNGWDKNGVPLSLDTNTGLWKVILGIDYGIYQYKYILNQKKMINDPSAEAYAPDGKGGKVSVIEVTSE